MHSKRLRRLGAIASMAAVLATGCVWNFETLDGAGGKPGSDPTSDMGQENTALLYNGRPHVFYWDGSTGDLRHTYWNGIAWAFETLDGAGGGNGRIDATVGEYSSAVVYNGRPHVFYWDDAGNLRHAYYNGITWAFETLDGPGSTLPGHTNNDVGRGTSTVLFGGRPHVFYHDDQAGTLRHAWWNGIAWSFEVLDGLGGLPGSTTHYVGEYPAAMLYNQGPHVFYYDRQDDSLRHAYWNGSVWAFETLDGTGSFRPGHTTDDVGRYGAPVLYNARPHVFYSNATAGSLRHAYWNGIAWAFETLDGTGSSWSGHTENDVGAYNAANLYGTKPNVYYQDDDDGTLRRSSYNGTDWVFEVLDGPGGLPGSTTNRVGSHNAALVVGATPHVFYYDEATVSLRHAWFG